VLTQIDSPVQVLDSFGLNRAQVFTLRKFVENVVEGITPISLVDDLASPGVLVAHRGWHFMMAARDDSRWADAMSDLFHERIDQSPSWPEEQLVKDWEEGRARGHANRGIFLDQAPLAAWQAAIDAGFKPDPKDNYENTANVWCAEGAPRYSHLIDPNHHCRLGVGEELVEYLKQGIEYDKEGEYIRRCLANGPSFVCEVNGEKVCWSCTHMSGTMGMIYTPPELRRKGYARSLAAFQIDHMLARDGFALCHVIATNTASQELLRGLGFTMVETPLVWRAVVWPE